MTDAQLIRLLNNVYRPKFKTKTRVKVPHINNVIYVDFVNKQVIK